MSHSLTAFPDSAILFLMARQHLLESSPKMFQEQRAHHMVYRIGDPDFAVLNPMQDNGYPGEAALAASFAQMQTNETSIPHAVRVLKDGEEFSMRVASGEVRRCRHRDNDNVHKIRILKK